MNVNVDVNFRARADYNVNVNVDVNFRARADYNENVNVDMNYFGGAILVAVSSRWLPTIFVTILLCA